MSNLKNITMENTKTGVELIAEERKRQIESEGMMTRVDKSSITNPENKIQ